MEGTTGQGQPQGEEQEYKSPQQVEFRGEFKPELVQAMDSLKNERTKAQDEMEITSISPESLQQLMEKSAEIEVSEAQEGDLTESSSQFVDNLMPVSNRRSRSRAPSFHMLTKMTLRWRQVNRKPFSTMNGTFGRVITSHGGAPYVRSVWMKALPISLSGRFGRTTVWCPGSRNNSRR